MNKTQMLQNVGYSQHSLSAVLSRQTQTRQRAQRRFVCQNAAQTEDCCETADDETAAGAVNLQQT